MHPVNKRRRYNVTSSLIGWVHTQNDCDGKAASRMGLQHPMAFFADNDPEPDTTMIVSCMETLSTLLTLCEGNPPVTGGFHQQRAGNTSFDIVSEVKLNKRLNKPSSCR